MSQYGKTRNLLSPKIFREINFLVPSLLIMLLCKKFWTIKCESKFPQFPHCVNISCSLKGKIFRQINFTAGFTKFLLSKISIIPNHIVEIKDNFTHTFFCKNLVKIAVFYFTKEITKWLIWRNFFCSLFHTVQCKILSSKKYFVKTTPHSHIQKSNFTWNQITIT